MVAKPALAVPAHLRPEGLAFLRNLARHNDREWFTPRKAVFEAELKEPMLAIIRKVTEAMESFAPGLCAARGEMPLPHLSRHPLQRRQKALQDARGRMVDRWQGWRRLSGAGYYFHVDAKEVVDCRRSLDAGEGSTGRDSPLAS